MTKLMKTLAISTACLCSAMSFTATAQTAPAAPAAAPSFSPEQEQRFTTFQANLQNKNLSQDYNRIVDCAGYAVYTHGLMKAMGAPAEATQNAQNFADSFIMTAMLVGMLNDPQNTTPESVQAVVKSNIETYKAVYPGDAVFKDASSQEKFKTCASYGKVNLAMITLARQAMAQQQQPAPQ